MDVVDEALGGGIRESFTVGSVVGDRSAVGLVAADRELDHAHAERLGRRGDGGVGDAVDPRGTEIGGESVAAVGHDAAADAVAGLEHQDGSAGSSQQAGRGQTCDPRADHDRVVMIQLTFPLHGLRRPQFDATETSRIEAPIVCSGDGCRALRAVPDPSAQSDVRATVEPMTKYLISFPSFAMDVADDEWDTVSEDSHAVIEEAKAAGVYVFGGGIDEAVDPIVSPAMKR